MATRPALFVFGIVASLSAIAIAADDDGVKAPYIEVGDCWSYSGNNLAYGGARIDNYELCVTHIDKVKDVILAVATVKDGGREIDLSFGSDWSWSTGITGLIATPSIHFLRFPIRVGDRYSFAYQFRNAVMGGVQGEAEVNMEVMGWEEVVVPAGRFRALKIVGQTAITRYDNSGNPYGRGKITIWYVPEVGRHVKHVYEDVRYFNWSEELTAYRLNK